LKPGQTQRVTGYADSVPLEGKKADDPQNRRISIVVLSNATMKREEEHRKSKGDANKPREPKPAEGKTP
jgi:hypothetical protein